MPRHSRHHDVYDDTNSAPYGERHPVPVIRRRRNDPQSSHGAMVSPSYGAVMDPFQDMHGAMRRMNEDMDRAFGTVGFGSMFGGGMMPSFDRMFEDMVSSAQGGNGTYYYESRTRTVGPDGRVHEEHVRTTPDEHGRPHTKRTVRDADTERDLDPFYMGSWGGQRVIRDSGLEPEVIIEEVEDDEAVPHEPSRRRSRRHRGDVEVEEVEEPRQGNAREWMRDRFRQWRSRH